MTITIEIDKPELVEQLLKAMGQAVIAPVTTEPHPVAVEEPQPQEEPQPKDILDPTPDPERVRALMEACRTRLLGEKGSDTYAKYHKELNNKFRSIATSVCMSFPNAPMCDKPTNLPGFAITAFGRELDELILGDSGIEVKVPF